VLPRTVLQLGFVFLHLLKPYNIEFRATRDQCGNFLPILVTVRFYSMVQLGDFGFGSFPRTPTSLDAGIQEPIPSALTLTFRSTRDQRSNRHPILATVRKYRILQLGVFVFYPSTRTSIRPVDAGIQDNAPSARTL
jgi:hypothetical protein